MKNLYKEGKTTRATGPGFYRFINDTLYVGGEIDVIPGAFTKEKDIWKKITKKQALDHLFGILFEGYPIVIRPEIAELERLL